MTTALDWHSQEFYYFLAAAGAIVIALSIGLYAVPGRALKVPGIAVSIVGSLGLGLAAGVMFMGVMGYQIKKEEPENPNPPQADAGGGGRGGGGRGGMMGGGGGGMMGGGMMGGGGGPGGGRGGGGGFGGPSPKTQLANLVGKLDLLTDKPLTVNLTEEQRKQLQEPLKGLAEADDLSDDDAREKMKKLHDVLTKEQRDSIRAAGYAWPEELGGARSGGGALGPGATDRGRGGEKPANPFKGEENAKHLKQLNERLGKG
jgi:hypothetical protein